MQKPRQHERAALLAEVTIGPGEQKPAQFGARIFNVSEGGAAVFTQHMFPVGKLVRMEVQLPDTRRSRAKVMLYGVIRRVTIRTEGNELGIEFVNGAEDHERFSQFLRDRQARTNRPWRAGFTLPEICVTLIIICLLATMATPIYSRAIEQARVDGAAGNLSVIWSAQRVYWLENRTYANSLAELETQDLVSRVVADSRSNPKATFVYRITSAGDDMFTATAQRSGSSVWLGQLVVDETGDVTGNIRDSGGVVLGPPS